MGYKYGKSYFEVQAVRQKKMRRSQFLLFLNAPIRVLKCYLN
jgi:hypothetical protein